MNIGKIISKSIKENKWLAIEYTNKEGNVTDFWCAIIDIDINKKTFKANIFNDFKSSDCITTYLYFDKIKSAKVLDFTTYDVPLELIDKIEKNILNLDWLEYESFNNNVLNYYEECAKLDSDPFQKEYCMVEGIDLEILNKNNKIILNNNQMNIILKKIYHYDEDNKDLKKYDLAISVLSVDEDNKKYILCYKDLAFNPKDKTLRITSGFKFNKSFLIEGKKHSLINYVNMDLDKFIELFNKDYVKGFEIVRNNLRSNEVINSRPDIFILEREFLVNLEPTFEYIERRYKENKLTVPLKAFFGNISRNDTRRKKEPTLVIYDNKINVNQMRVIYNAMKFPVTYVQGPPGTGKTQTILNVVLSAFFDDKTVLICSSNNKPVDGIVEKLKFTYRDEKINFPYLRLGRFEDVIKATLRIRKLYEFKTDKEAKEHIMNRIKDEADKANSELVSYLNIQEERTNHENYIESSTRLLNDLKDSNSTVAKNLRTRVNKLKEELSQMKVITNSDIKKTFTPIFNNPKMMQLMYYKSLGLIAKLHFPRYKELIDICYIEDDTERATEFNKWVKNTDNMRLLNQAFPIIFSTNISSHRLGYEDYMFNLVIMDEAGQCNVSHALIPISKAENLLLVGDPNQLKPVIILEDSVNEILMNKYNVKDDYNYKENSILDVMIKHDPISKYILLKYHYRCGKKIIKFSNDRYYNSSLDLSFIEKDGSISFLDVKNSAPKERNTALEEAMAIIDYIKRNEIHNASIVTPFVNQQNLINRLLISQNINDVKCGTIHSLQGDERDCIILSTALSLKTSKRTYEWIKNNFELINVGITRAKNKLIISGDMDAINLLSDKKDDLYNLVKYAESDGKIIVPPNEYIKIEIGKSNNSKNEDEFYKTISQFCSVHTHYEAKRNVPLSIIFKDEPILSKSKKEFDLVIYEKKMLGTLVPKIVIELNGGEHFCNKRRELSDNYKRLVCNERKIKFLMIDNSFIKSYEFIKDLIIGSKNKKTMQLSFNDLGLE